MASSASNNTFKFDELEELLEQTWKVFKQLTGAPEQLRDLKEGLLSVLSSLRLLVEHLTDTQLSHGQVSGLGPTIDRAGNVVSNVEKQLGDVRKGELGIDDLRSSAKGVLVCAGRLEEFHEGLIRTSRNHVLGAFEGVVVNAGWDSQSLTWDVISAKLQGAGHSLPAIEENYFLINNRLQSRTTEANISGAPVQQSVQSRPDPGTAFLDPRKITDDAASGHTSIGEASSSSSITRLPSNLHIPDASEELPGYEPGSRSIDTREKADLQERTTAIENATASADPPKYTFDSQGNTDNEMDSDLATYIQSATAYELKRRYKARELSPHEGPFVYSWLPEHMQESFRGRPDIVSLLDAKSFSVMGYETAPRITHELEKLMPALQLSADGSGDDTIFLEAINTVKVMIKALARFVSIQNPVVGKTFSDLDELDYECDTARAIDTELPFPYEHFELAQQSYYHLLTYIMGMTDLMKDIFAGHVFVLRSRQTLAQLCHEKRIIDRTAWIRKQLAGWAVVDEAVLACRNWQRLHSTRELAIGALEAWQQSISVLLGCSPPSYITLNIISATGLQKAHNYKCEITFWHTKMIVGKVASTARHFEHNTAIIKNTRCPVWNEEIVVDVPMYPKMIDVVLWDTKYAGRNMGHVRLRFENVPGVEKTLFGKDLMFGFDETLTAQVVPDTTSKGKEVDAIVLEFSLAWKGRYELLEETGLLAHPPGKMFRASRSHVPMPFRPIERHEDTSKEQKWSKQQL